MTTVVGDLVVLIRGDAKPLQASLTQAQASTSKFGAAMSSFGSLAPLAFAAAGAAALKFAADSVSAAAEAEAVFAQTEAVIESTGGAAGVTADEMRDLAAAFQASTTFSDEAVLSAENLLLTFTKIGGETIPDATQAVLDMSTALGQDLKSSAIQLGKALNNPTVGLTALRRVGVAFSDDQVELIQRLDRTGHSLEAQRIILDELAKEFGGSAAAATETFAGRVAQLQNEFNDIQEEIGRELIPVLEDLLPALGDLAKTILPAVASALGDVVDEITPAVEGFNLLADAISGVGGSVPGADGGFDFTDLFLLPSGDPGRDLTDRFMEALFDTRDELVRERAEWGAVFEGIRSDAGVLEGLWDDYISDVNSASDAERRHADALGLTLSAMREAAGGLLGLIEASRTYAQAQNRVNQLEANGKKGTKEYRDAVAALLTERLELDASIEALRDAWAEEGVSLREAKASLQQVGRQAGLEGAALRRFITNGLKPVRNELDGLKNGSPYKAQVVVTISGERSLSSLQSKLEGLDARYDLGVAVSAATSTSGGGGSTGDTTRRRRREEAYLDRQRFERDHAYSRQYEGWR